MHFAAEDGHIEVVMMLMEAGSDPHIMEKKVKTRLDRAIDNSNLIMMRKRLRTSNFRIGFRNLDYRRKVSPMKVSILPSRFSHNGQTDLGGASYTELQNVEI